MILPLVLYGDPVLREKGASIGKITDEHRKLAQNLLETMRANNGLGLAAQQVGRALQMTVIDVRGIERPSQMFIGVREVSVESLMPLVLINPAVSRPRGEEVGVEGCLSFPGVSLEIRRAHEVTVEALDISGKKLRFTCTGLLARAVQHELDHLNGVLFVDRVEADDLDAVQPLLSELEARGKPKA
jgi:peptide deformylase